jgi:hypothetical protein
MKLPSRIKAGAAALLVLILFISPPLLAQTDFPGKAPGRATVFLGKKQFVLENKALRLTYTFGRGRSACKS